MNPGMAQLPDPYCYCASHLSLNTVQASEDYYTPYRSCTSGASTFDPLSNTLIRSSTLSSWCTCILSDMHFVRHIYVTSSSPTLIV